MVKNKECKIYLYHIRLFNVLFSW